MKHKAIVFKIDSNYFTSSNLNDLKVIPKNNTEDVLSLIEQPVLPQSAPFSKNTTQSVSETTGKSQLFDQGNDTDEHV